MFLEYFLCGLGQVALNWFLGELHWFVQFWGPVQPETGAQFDLLYNLVADDIIAVRVIYIHWR